MEWVSVIMALADGELLKIIAGSVATIGGIIAILFKRRKWRQEGRDEIIRENEIKRSEKLQELSDIRDEQADAALNRPNDDGLNDILDKGKF